MKKLSLSINSNVLREFHRAVRLSNIANHVPYRINSRISRTMQTGFFGRPVRYRHKDLIKPHRRLVKRRDKLLRYMLKNGRELNR